MSGKFFGEFLGHRRPMGGRWPRERLSAYGAVVLAAWVCIGTAAMSWIAYGAIREWERSTSLSLQRRANEVLALLSVALNRDMKGAQISVLVPISHYDLHEPPYDLADVVVRAFGRFPYPESFFAWQDDGTPNGITYLFNRADRRPAWDVSPSPQEPYPVVLVANPPQARGLVAQARRFGRSGSRFAFFVWKAAGVTYHVVVQLLYGRPENNHLVGLVGFTVNLDWIRHKYFAEILRQVQWIDGREGGLSLTILDDTGRLVATTGERPTDGPATERSFSLLFLDQSLVSSLPPGAPPIHRWVARVNASRDPALLAASAGAHRTLLLITGAIFATVVALVLIVRAVRVSAQLAVLKSDFVSTATHELKTPLALIRLVSETLAKGRYSSRGTISDYAALLSSQSARLTRLIDNLLTSARLNDIEAAYAFEVLDPADVVEDALERFRPQLEEGEFSVALELPPDLPQIRGDHAMLGQVFDNLIDNAIRYADSTRSVRITGSANGHSIRIDVLDKGQGIPADELPRLFEKFFRGRHTTAGGSGLGLAIVRQVVIKHGGSVAIRSILGSETVVSITLPTAEVP